MESDPKFSCRPDAIYRAEVGEHLSINCSVDSDLPTGLLKVIINKVTIVF